jgi:hypothetical protein
MPGMAFDHARLCREKPPLRFERMPFIPRLKSLGFSGMVYKGTERFMTPEDVTLLS